MLSAPAVSMQDCQLVLNPLARHMATSEYRRGHVTHSHEITSSHQGGDGDLGDLGGRAISRHF